MLVGNGHRVLAVFAVLMPRFVQITVTVMPSVVQTVVTPMVSMMVTDAGNSEMRLGASLRDRATLPSPLRRLDPSGGYPSRLRSLRSLRAPLARRLAALTAAAGPIRSAHRSTPASGRPPLPPRAGAARRARRGPRLARPSPAAPATGCASASSRRTPCVAGAGFAPHRPPHRAVQQCPHSRGHHRLRLRQRAAHACPRLRPHRPPLKRRGGSPPPASPASMPPSLMPLHWPSRTARGGLGSHTRRTDGALPPPLRTGAMGMPPKVRNHTASMPCRAGTSATKMRAQPLGGGFSGGIRGLPGKHRGAETVRPPRT